MKKWKVLSESVIRSQESGIKDVIKIILENRGLKIRNEIEEFLNPKLENITVKSVGIDKKQLQKAVQRIQTAIEEKEQIVVFGDYDVDGICGTAILWETLNSLEAKVLPYIPHRVEEGYGLSTKAIQNSVRQFGGQNIKLIITVDNGIVANEAVKFANKQGIDVIVTDHHVPPKKLPDAFATVHTTKLCGAGVAWVVAQELKVDNKDDDHLELVALATIADLVPLLGANRTLLKFGLEKLRQTKRAGLLEVFKEAVLEKEKIGVYEIGHIIAPRLNAMGRLEHAIDSLRLLCTRSTERAKMLAQTLGTTNRERQKLTIETVEHARTRIMNYELRIKNLLFVSDESYQQGVIGLVAGKLAEEFYKPAIVVSIGEKYSKASARSINGFNIIEFIRSASEFLVDAGGHPMAAGFTVETSKLTLLKKKFEQKAEELLDEEKLTRSLRIDCELDLSIINNNLYNEIQKLAPFGMGNPEPTFVSKNVVVEDKRVVGNGGKHIKFKFKVHPSDDGSKFKVDGIGFGMGELYQNLHVGDKIDIAYTIDLNVWNGNSSLQLKIKDMKPSST